MYFVLLNSANSNVFDTKVSTFAFAKIRKNQTR